jgi:tetratricopeptide (TPR) repeat protein
MALQPLRVPALPLPRLASKVLVLFGVLGIYYARCRTTELDCAHAVREATDGVAVAVCEREYVRTGDPLTGIRLANALRRSSDLLAASAIATNLIATSARADALFTLSKIAVEQDRLDDALQLLQRAREAHVAQANLGALAADDQALADIAYRRDHYGDALRAADSCILEAQSAGDPVLEGYCHMAAGKVLSQAGYFETAQDELSRAELLLTTHRDLGELATMRGQLYQLYQLGPMRQNYNALAVEEFERAIEHTRLASRPKRLLVQEIDLTFTLAELGRFDDAARHLEAARGLDLHGESATDFVLLEAKIAYQRGDRARAYELNQRIVDSLRDDEDSSAKLSVTVMQARIALANGDPDLAASWAQRGITVVEKRREKAALELRPWVVSLRRQPYELMFVALVRAHKLADAVVVFDQWYGRTLLDALSERGIKSATLQHAAAQTEALRERFPAWSTAPIMHTLEPGALLAKLAKVDLIALVIAENEVWRIAAHGSDLEIVDVGPLAQLLPQIARLQTAPTDRALAEALGAPLLGEAAFRATTDTLHVVLDGRLSTLPVAALRAHGPPLIALRAVVQPPRLSEVDCVPAPPATPRAAVIADAKGDLPAARELAIWIAHRLGVEPRLGPRATSEAVMAATDADLLHVAVHAKIERGGGALLLHDRALSALEIVGPRSPAPALAVLEACNSGTADDLELSLATAFLASGSRQVVATSRPVTDAGAHDVIQGFYLHLQAASDPVRALAEVQAELAKTKNPDWPYFSIFGHDTCRKDSP